MITLENGEEQGGNRAKTEKKGKMISQLELGQGMILSARATLNRPRN